MSLNEFVYKEFDTLVYLLIEEYQNESSENESQQNKNKRYRNMVKELTVSIKVLYNNKELFQYILERYYSSPLNPFTTAYHDFMNWYNSGNEPNDLFRKIADSILRRKIYENINENIHTIF